MGICQLAGKEQQHAEEDRVRPHCRWIKVTWKGLAHSPAARLDIFLGLWESRRLAGTDVFFGVADYDSLQDQELIRILWQQGGFQRMFPEVWVLLVGADDILRNASCRVIWPGLTAMQCLNTAQKGMVEVPCIDSTWIWQLVAFAIWHVISPFHVEENRLCAWILQFGSEFR